MPPAPTSSARVSLNDMARRGGDVQRERFRVGRECRKLAILRPHIGVSTVDSSKKNKKFGQ
jgi:hypothetical protein